MLVNVNSVLFERCWACGSGCGCWSGTRFFSVAFFCFANTSALLPLGVVGEESLLADSELESDSSEDDGLVSVNDGGIGGWGWFWDC